MPISSIPQTGVQPGASALPDSALTKSPAAGQDGPIPTPATGAQTPGAAGNSPAASPATSDVSGKMAPATGAPQTTQTGQSAATTDVAAPKPASQASPGNAPQTGGLATEIALARQDAAARPGGMAPLMADLAQIAASISRSGTSAQSTPAALPAETFAQLPVSTQTAITQILGLRLSAETAPSGSDISRAFSQSGLFTEANIAAATQNAATGSTGLIPMDIKLLILMMRHSLKSLRSSEAGGTASTASTRNTGRTGAASAPSTGPAGTATGPAGTATGPAGTASGPTGTATGPASTATSPASTATSPASSATGPASSATGPASSATGPAGMATSPAGQIPVLPVNQVATGLPQPTEPAQSGPQSPAIPQTGTPAPTTPSSPGADNSANLSASPPAASDTQNADTARFSSQITALLARSGYGITPQETNSDPDILMQRALMSGTSLPLADGPTVGQVAQNSLIRNDTDLDTMVRYLLFSSEAALSHQKLLQFASLQNADGSQKTSSPHWMFEIPIATADGTAMAQFAIDKDGGGQNPDGTRKEPTWRVRFSIDIAPLGPVHVSLSLSEKKTWVSMWSPNPQTLATLREGAEELTGALTEADLPAEISFTPVKTPQSAVRRTGHFLDSST